ncbi:MAG: DoxX family membrane protein [Fibrobacterales bacterium]|nr:DoxX family membrane protein [Fibrobacterales bacterium]
MEAAEKNSGAKSALAVACCVLSALLCCVGALELLGSDLADWPALRNLTLAAHSKFFRFKAHFAALIEYALAFAVWIPAFFARREWATRYMNLACRVGLGLMFVFASLFKIQDPQLFARLVAQYLFLPQPLVNVWALWLPPVEFVVGILLIAGPKTRWNARLVLLMFVAFIVALAQAVIRDLGITCGCFELEGAMDKTEAWVSLVRDLILLVPTVWLSFFGRDLWIWDLFRKSPEAR